MIHTQSLRNHLGIQLIGISGAPESGKDTSALYLHGMFQDTYIEHFADPLKAAVSAAFGIDVSALNSTEQKKLIHPFWKTTNRKILQFFGTEMFRETINRLIAGTGPNFWVDRMYGKLTGELLLDGDGVYGEGDTVVIPDVRFQNEIDFIYAHGGITIFVKRRNHETDVGGFDGHASEQLSELRYDPHKHYLLVNDGTIPDLHTEIEKILPAIAEVHSIKLTRTSEN